MTKIFKTKIQSWCKDSPKALKNIEASIASGNTNDGKIETNTVLLNTIKGFSKHREIWTASYFVNVIPILYTDPATGEKTQFKLNDKPQFEKSPNGKVNSRIRYRLRCDENKIAMTQSVIYLKNGVVSESQSLTEAQINSNWSDVVPGSTGESILVFVCAL